MIDVIVAEGWVLPRGGGGESIMFAMYLEASSGRLIRLSRAEARGRPGVFMTGLKD